MPTQKAAPTQEAPVQEQAHTSSDYERERGKPIPSIDKIEDMLAAGVQSCWLAQPNLQLVTVFTGGMEKTTYTEGVITDPATGIEVALADIFQAA